MRYLRITRDLHSQITSPSFLQIRRMATRMLGEPKNEMTTLFCAQSDELHH